MVMWYCFKAGCHIRGRTKSQVTEESLKEALRTPTPRGFADKFNTTPFKFIPLSKAPLIITMKKNHAYLAFADHRADIRYDPKQNRMVFIVYDNGTPVDAIGRRLGVGSKIPKWHRYGKAGQPFVCKKGKATRSDTLVVVEDCFSACAATVAHDGAALMGTSLYATFIPVFKKYKKIIIALDADATREAMEIQKNLNWHVPTRVVRLEEDLKGMPPLMTKRLFA